jgi:hypothetical protein
MDEFILPRFSVKYVDPIIYCKYNEETELGFPEIIELASYIESLGNKKPYLIFLDVSLIRTVTNEGRRMMERYRNISFCMGTAVFVNENKYECTRNFVNSYNTKFPFRAFNAEKEAIDWLLSLSLDR